MEGSEPDGLEVPVVWVGAEDVPVLLANQFVIQADVTGEMFLTIGQMVPPALVGTLDERREQAEALSFVPIKTVARIAMTVPRLRELVQVLQITLENHEKRSGEFGDPRG